MSSWEELIRSTSVKELVRSKDLDLVYFKTGTTIRDALHVHMIVCFFTKTLLDIKQ